MISFDQREVQELQINSTQELAAALDPGDVTWVDVQGFGDETLIREIGELFSIHPLGMQDAVNMPQRPKVEEYDGQVLIITRMVRVKGTADLEMEQVTFVLGENDVLTFQERYGDILDSVRERIRTGQGRPIRRSGPGYLCYAIVDTIIDGYYPVIEALGDHLEQLENQAMENPGLPHEWWALREEHRLPVGRREDVEAEASESQ